MLNKHSIIWLLTTCILLFAGCSDDFYSIDTDYEEEPFKEGLTIFVPRVEETRALPDGITADEVKLNSLTLFLLRYENDEYKELFVKQLKDERTAVKVTSEYEAYNIENLPQGDYKVYICANIFNAAQDTDESLTSHFSNVIGTQTVEGNILSRTYNFGAAYFKYDLSANDVHGLPMSCMHAEFRTDKTDATKALGTNYFKFTGKESLFADMTFALAKVTVAVEGAAGDNLEINKTTLSGHLNKFDLFNTKSFSGFTVGTDLTIEDRKDLVAKPVYVSETNGSNDPKLTLEYDAKKIEISLGEENESTGHHDVLRGCHYEYVVKRDGKIDLTVKGWAPRIDMNVAINGTIELVLEDTKIKEMVSGTWYEIPYKSNAERVTVVPPTFTSGNKSIPFYDYQVTPTHIRVKLNDNVSLKDYNDYANKDQLKYFHVMADNIMKRVDVEKVTAKANFDITPQNVVIDLREMIASAKSEVVDTIRFGSNLDKVTTNITSVKWKDADGKELSGMGYQVTESGFTLPVFDYQRSTDNPESPNGEDYIVLRYLDQGAKFWQTEKTLEVTYTVSGSADQMSQLTTDAEKKVTVKVIPFSSNYKIHFRANNGQNWIAPHIYVYQCLELPYGIAKNAGRTVGISGTEWAALEYNFTGDFAFKGWSGYGGTISHNDGEGVDNIGFIFMDGFNYDDNVGTENDTKTYRWMKLNSAHYSKISSQTNCQAGRCKEYKEVVQSWPGIVMYKEAEGGPLDGWWTYELSGVATPGKTLIMFSDGGEGNTIKHTGTGSRFPGDNCVGVALFDYEDKEGWFLLTNTDDKDYTANHFYDDNPLAELEAKKKTYRFYWNYKDSKGLNLYNDGANWTPVNAEYSGSGTQVAGEGKFYMHSNGYAVWEVRMDPDKLPDDIYVAKYNSESDFDFKKGLFDSDNDGVKSVYLDFSNKNVSGGEPPAKTVVTITGDYNIAYSGSREKVHYWGGSKSSNYPGEKMTEVVVDGNTYKVYKVDSGTTQVLFATGETGTTNKTSDFAYSSIFIYDDNGPTDVVVKFVSPSSVRRKPVKKSSSNRHK
ncbi:MAG: hypothetical protein K2G23_09895 [Muribaculaceae bacterium]|nr:hypothetical protein [Muribaculaceae bacterium]